MRSSEITSILVGMPQTLPDEKPWTTGFLKRSVESPLWLGATNLSGDGQADRVHHGGPHKAICVYTAEHYSYWRQSLGLPELTDGDFGENFTVAEITEHDVCIGDVWSIGDAVVQVSQPRQPCWKLARRWNIKDLAYQVQQTGYTGWYLRVLTQGEVQRGMTMRLSDRPHEKWTIAEANRIMHDDPHNLAAALKLALIPELSPSWHATLTKRAETGRQPDASKRLMGQRENS